MYNTLPSLAHVTIILGCCLVDCYYHHLLFFGYVHIFNHRIIAPRRVELLLLLILCSISWLIRFTLFK